MEISELKVMQSAAGYYLGHSCETDDMPKIAQPYSRKSIYFPSKEKAQRMLDHINRKK